MKRIMMLVAVALLGSSQAFAGFMIEPYLGYETGDYTQGTNKGDVTGTYLGARLGYSMLGLMFGADYQMTTGESESSGGSTSDLSGSDMGLFVGYEFPIMLRVYATYFMTSKTDSEAGGSTTELEGSGTRLGIGYTGLPFVAINFEMMSRTHDEANGTSLGANEFEFDTMALNISLPLP